MRLEIETRRFYLGRDYSEAVQGAGGLPVHIPLIPDEEYIETLMSDLDGVLLPGADCDVDPAYYGEDPHPRLGRVVPEKDKTDRLVLEHAERLDLPVLAICYGMQALNVWRGGSLVQDIDAQIEGCMKHRQGEPLDRHSHSVSIAEKNSLFDVAGKAAASVNSHHHQAVRRTGSRSSSDRMGERWCDRSDRGCASRQIRTWGAVASRTSVASRRAFARYL
jgi:putative glutamine amidotransferase